MRAKVFWTPQIVLWICLFLSVFAWHSASDSVYRSAKAKFDREIDETLLLFEEHLQLYFDVLYGLQNFFAAAKSIERDDWIAYNNLRMLQKRVPGISGIGFAERVRLSDAQNFTQKIRSDNATAARQLSDFQIFPVGERDEYYVMKFFEPYEKNIFTAGFDVLTDPVRKEAFERARDSGEITFTGRLTKMVPEGADPLKSSILMILPIYRSGMPVSTVEERRGALLGFVEIICEVEDLLSDIFKSKMIRPDMDFDIFDGAPLASENLLYHDMRAEHLMEKGYRPTFFETRVVNVGGRSWTLRFVALPDYQIGPIREIFPVIVLGGGIVFSFLIFGILYSLSTSRLRAVNLAEKMTEDLRLEIEERKKAEEEARKAFNIKSDFVSIVSHELRTPLTAINESIRIVLDGSAGTLNEEQKDFLDTAKRNVERLSRLINDVLSLQRLESGQIRYQMHEADLNQIVTETKESFKLLAQNKGIEIEAKHCPSLPLILMDRDKISQVLANLVHNAIKFSDKGNISLKIERDGKFAKVSIIDQGIGIRQEDIGKLFERFAQLPSEKGRKTGGTGLGLAISKRIIEAHHGTIGIHSEFGCGTTVFFYLPISLEGGFQ